MSKKQTTFVRIRNRLLSLLYLILNRLGWYKEESLNSQPTSTKSQVTSFLKGASDQNLPDKENISVTNREIISKLICTLLFHHPEAIYENFNDGMMIENDLISFVYKFGNKGFAIDPTQEDIGQEKKAGIKHILIQIKKFCIKSNLLKEVEADKVLQDIVKTIDFSTIMLTTLKEFEKIGLNSNKLVMSNFSKEFQSIEMFSNLVVELIIGTFQERCKYLDVLETLGPLLQEKSFITILHKIELKAMPIYKNLLKEATKEAKDLISSLILSYEVIEENTKASSSDLNDIIVKSIQLFFEKRNSLEYRRVFEANTDSYLPRVNSYEARRNSI
jgi:hypothetical protein